MFTARYGLSPYITQIIFVFIRFKNTDQSYGGRKGTKWIKYRNTGKEGRRCEINKLALKARGLGKLLGYRLYSPGRNPIRSIRFFSSTKCPAWLWGPTSLCSTDTRVLYLCLHGMSRRNILLQYSMKFSDFNARYNGIKSRPDKMRCPNCRTIYCAQRGREQLYKFVCFFFFCGCNFSVNYEFYRDSVIYFTAYFSLMK